ncbi:hypothetical protein BJD99_08375 [Rhodococcus sp. 1163]|nr:hypothetical protein BJD99_08375 [Rhodococcus sp. 1163]
MERWLTLAIAAYHPDVHTGIRRSIAAQWTSSDDADNALSTSTVVDETAFLVDFLPVIRRRLTRAGFVIDHIQYFSNALRSRITRREKLGQFVIRRDPRDPSKVWVLDPDSGSGYVEAPYRSVLDLSGSWRVRPVRAWRCRTEPIASIPFSCIGFQS